MSRVFTAILTTYLGIKYEDLAYGVKNGFAVVGSNNGHNGTTAVTMYHNYDVQIDFSWRAYVTAFLYLLSYLSNMMT